MQHAGATAQPSWGPTAAASTSRGGDNKIAAALAQLTAAEAAGHAQAGVAEAAAAEAEAEPHAA